MWIVPKNPQRFRRMAGSAQASSLVLCRASRIGTVMFTYSCSERSVSLSVFVWTVMDFEGCALVSVTDDFLWT